MAKPYKIIISCGGTGGHIYPAIAVAQAFKALNPANEILFVGAEGKMEMEKVPKAGFQIIGLAMRGLQRSLSFDNLLKNLFLPFQLLSSLWKARQILHDFKPDVVIGFGGYASFAVLQMADFQQVPVFIQEQNSYAGLANKWLSRFAKKIFVAYPNMEKFFDANKIVFTGNPIREDIANLSDIRTKSFEFFELNPQKKTLLIIGGSLGAKTINDCLLNGVARLLQADHQIIWQTGKGYFSNIQQKLTSFLDAKLAKNLIVKEFIYEMQFAYACADLVISRAGALSISELCLAQKATILVPSPNVAEDHQTKNAMALQEKQACILVKDAEAKEILIDKTLDLLRDENELKKLQKNIFNFAKTNSAQLIANQVVSFL
ncbi:MAG: undecaprenyldiphospho-muramoylpentapeptide beta-N-acetylglucosaminyltransferase [Bacteroidetes bacterium]|nr:MAG: undecaprenyldiphospho-muramoylpentapeptide beta-N-acetylglucosaminyltransferase [Bacteroidota bacterium]